MIAEEVDDEDVGKQQQKKAATAEQAQRSTDPVDRTCTACTGSEIGRPPGRPKSLTVSTQLSVGHPVDRWKGRSTARSTDKRVRAASADLKICLYLRGWLFSRVCILVKILEKEKVGALLHSKRLLAIVIIFQVN